MFEPGLGFPAVTLLPLKVCDGGRKAAGFGDATDKDCVIRAIAIGTGRPYTDVLDMVNVATGVADAAEVGVPVDRAEDLLRGLRWRAVPARGKNPRLTLEDLPLDDYPRLIVQTLSDPTEGDAYLTGHLTAVVNDAVHDLKTLEEATAPGYARPDQVTSVYAPPKDNAGNASADTMTGASAGTSKAEAGTPRLSR